MCNAASRTFSKLSNDDLNITPSKKARIRITSPVIERNWFEDADNISKQRRQSENRSQITSPVRVKRTNKRPSVYNQVLYGKFPVQLALMSQRRTIHKLYMRDSLLDISQAEQDKVISDIRMMAQQRNITIQAVTKKYLDALVQDPEQGIRQHQGVCADVSALSDLCIDEDISSLVKPTKGDPRIWLVTQAVQDPNNFGAIMRTACYLGVDLVITYNSCKLSPAVSKVSAGAIEEMNIYKTNNLLNLLKICQDHQWQVLGTASDSSQKPSISPHSVAVDKDTIVVLGNEGCGLTEDVVDLCHELITIPNTSKSSHSALESLNVSVSAGIILYQLMNGKKSNNSHGR